MFMQRYLSQPLLHLNYRVLGVELSVPSHGSCSSHCQSHLNIVRNIIIIDRVGWWCDLGTSCRTGAKKIIIRCIIRIGTLQSNGSEPVWITPQKFDSWHSRLVRPCVRIGTHVNRHLGPGGDRYYCGYDQDLFHVYI